MGASPMPVNAPRRRDSVCRADDQEREGLLAVGRHVGHATPRSASSLAHRLRGWRRQRRRSPAARRAPASLQNNHRARAAENGAAVGGIRSRGKLPLQHRPLQYHHVGTLGSNGADRRAADGTDAGHRAVGTTANTYSGNIGPLRARPATRQALRCPCLVAAPIPAPAALPGKPLMERVARAGA